MAPCPPCSVKPMPKGQWERESAVAFEEVTMRVWVRLYATLRAYLPEAGSGGKTTVELPEKATVGDLVKQLGLPSDEVKVTFVNGRARSPDWVLQPEDEVGVFPPIGGG